MDFREIIFNDIMQNYNKKYKEYNTLEEYLNSYTRDDLYRLAVRYGIINGDNKLGEVIIANTSTKSKMLKYVVDNIEEIIKSVLLPIGDNNIEILNKVLENKNTLVIEDRSLPLTLILNLGDTPVIHVHYDKKKDLITINIQKDIALIINKILKNKAFIKGHHDLLDFEKNIEMLLEVYGLIEEDLLYDIYTKVFENIERKIFDKYLMYITLKDCPLDRKHFNNINYISKLDLEDYEIEDYISNREGEYEIYSKDFYENVENRTYLKGLKSYENLCDFFQKYYDFDLNEEDDIFELIVCDYLYQMQESKVIARKAIITNLDQYFNINSKRKNEIINYLNKIYYDYPKWRKKGNI